jgi:hypothetical protein
MAMVSDALLPMLRRSHRPNSEGDTMAGHLVAYDLGPAAGVLVGVIASCGLWALIAWVVSLAV